MNKVRWVWVWVCESDKVIIKPESKNWFLLATRKSERARNDEFERGLGDNWQLTMSCVINLHKLPFVFRKWPLHPFGIPYEYSRFFLFVSQLFKVIFLVVSILSPIFLYLLYRLKMVSFVRLTEWKMLILVKIKIKYYFEKIII